MTTGSGCNNWHGKGRSHLEALWIRPVQALAGHSGWPLKLHCANPRSTSQLAQYEGKAIIALSAVCADYFTHLTIEMFQRKVLAGQIKIPITRLEPSQKSAKGIHITDLANYLDEQREAALKECRQLNGAFAVARRGPRPSSLALQAI